MLTLAIRPNDPTNIAGKVTPKTPQEKNLCIYIYIYTHQNILELSVCRGHDSKHVFNVLLNMNLWDPFLVGSFFAAKSRFLKPMLNVDMLFRSYDAGRWPFESCCLPKAS